MSAAQRSVDRRVLLVTATQEDTASDEAAIF